MIKSGYRGVHDNYSTYTKKIKKIIYFVMNFLCKDSKNTCNSQQYTIKALNYSNLLYYNNHIKLLYQIRS